MYLNECEMTCFRHDGAPAHFLFHVRQHLIKVCGEKWTDQGGPVP